MELSVKLRPRTFSHKETFRGTSLIVGLVSCSARQDDVESEKISLICRESKHDSSVVQPGHCTD